MPRIPRGQVSGYTYHVLNRGNAGAVIFHTNDDDHAFLELLAGAKKRFPVKAFGFCLMPTHFHLVVQPAHARALSPFMQWWLTSHVRRHHRHYLSSGHLWQGRFKSFPIQQDDHLLVVLRYVLRNPVRAGLVERPDEWLWSSLRQGHLTDPWPVATPRDWAAWVHQPVFPQGLADIRACVNRQAPFGSFSWREEVARAGGFETTLRGRGRPRKRAEK